MARGGVLSATEPLTWRWAGAWTLEVVAYCSVDLFAMLTGYLCVGRPRRSCARLVGLLLQATFWNVLFTVVFLLLFGWGFFDGWREVVGSLLPPTIGRHWYVCCYVPVFLLAPYANRLVESLDRRQARLLCGLLLVVFGLLPSVTRLDPFATASGYSFWWLMVCYVLGACLRLHGAPALRGREGRVFLLCVALVLAGKCAIAILLGRNDSYLLGYESPLMVCMAACAISACARLGEREVSWRAGRLLATLSSLTFDVYIVHGQITIYDHLITGGFAWIATEPAPLVVLLSLASATAIFAAGAILGLLRRRLFEIPAMRGLIAKLTLPLDHLLYGEAGLDG